MGLFLAIQNSMSIRQNGFWGIKNGVLASYFWKSAFLANFFNFWPIFSIFSIFSQFFQFFHNFWPKLGSCQYGEFELKIVMGNLKKMSFYHYKSIFSNFSQFLANFFNFFTIFQNFHNFFNFFQFFMISKCSIYRTFLANFFLIFFNFFNFLKIF